MANWMVIPELGALSTRLFVSFQIIIATYTYYVSIRLAIFLVFSTWKSVVATPIYVVTRMEFFINAHVYASAKLR